MIIDGGLNDIRIISLITAVLVMTVVLVGVEFEAKVTLLFGFLTIFARQKSFLIVGSDWSIGSASCLTHQLYYRYLFTT